MQATNKMPSPGVLQEVCFRVFDVHLRQLLDGFSLLPQPAKRRAG
jgi:hypothetical protein